MAIESVKASARKKKPGMPLKNASGRKTTTLAAVEAISARRMRAVPSRTVPRRTIASITTITSSITRPTATAKPPTVIKLSESPASEIASTESIIAKGTIKAAISVMARLRKKR